MNNPVSKSNFRWHRWIWFNGYNFCLWYQSSTKSTCPRHWFVWNNAFDWYICIRWFWCVFNIISQNGPELSIGNNKPSIFGTNASQPATNNPFGGGIFGNNQQQPSQPGTSTFGTGTGGFTSTFGTNVPQNQPTSCTCSNYYIHARRNSSFLSHSIPSPKHDFCLGNYGNWSFRKYTTESSGATDTATWKSIWKFIRPEDNPTTYRNVIVWWLAVDSAPTTDFAVW